MWNSLLCSAVRLPSSASRVLVASLSILFKLQLINQQCRPRKRNTCDCLTCRLAEKRPATRVRLSVTQEF
jgi:hypothetical protein